MAVDRELVRELTLASRKALCDENDYLLTNYLKKHRKDDNVAVNEGIARFNNERFFQYIIARHLVVAKGYLVNLEKQTFDMTLYRESARTSPVALCEIKRWMSEFGEREIPSIVSDLKKLRDSKQSNTFEIVITLEREKSWPEFRMRFVDLMKKIGSVEVEIVDSRPFPTRVDRREWVVFSVLKK